MTSTASSPKEYLDSLPAERQEPMAKLRAAIVNNLPGGFREEMSYGMLGYVVPHSLYPAGYHCNPKLPLPFINLASQKNFIALYHMGLYLNADLMTWFKDEYAKQSKAKLDMGKSCIRFKNMAQIPYELIGELMKKTSPAEWIACYEALLKTPRKQAEK